MGKGDRKTEKGKRWRQSYGNTRPSKNSKKKKYRLKKAKVVNFKNQIRRTKFLNNQYLTFKLLEEEYNRRLSKDPNNEEIKTSIQNISEAKEKVLADLDKSRKETIGYSVEEIFVNNGQYDRFVSIEFYPGSESFEKFGESIMGTFIFSQFERKFLKRYIGQSSYPRTYKKIRFDPSELCNLNESKIKELKSIGIDNRDIKTIFQTGTRYENRYAKKPEYKEVPNTIKIKVRDDGYNYGPMMLHIYESRIKKGNYPLIPVEYDQYLALKYRYKKDSLTQEEESKIFKPGTEELKPNIADAYIEHKFYTENELSETDNELFKQYIKGKTEKAKVAVNREVLKSGSKSLLDIIKDDMKTYMKALMLAAQFKPENLSTYGAKHSVRMELDGFLHIVLRHCKGYQFGDWKNKRTTFEYVIKDVIRILKIIIKDLQKDIDESLSKGEDFQLVKGSAYNYDGNYYAIHINKNGELVSFYPRNK